MQERLLQIGDWMKTNGQAIYEASRWKTPAQWGPGRRDYKPATGSGDLLLKLTVDPDSGYAVKECFFTYNADRKDLYVILPKWPGSSFTIHNLPLAPGTRIEWLDTHQGIFWRPKGNDCILTLPAFDPNRIKTPYAFVLKIHGVSQPAKQ
jgi:alpha-L-fucosidase